MSILSLRSLSVVRPIQCNAILEHPHSSRHWRNKVWHVVLPKVSAQNWSFSTQLECILYLTFQRLHWLLVISHRTFKATRHEHVLSQPPFANWKLADKLHSLFKGIGDVATQDCDIEFFIIYSCLVNVLLRWMPLNCTKGLLMPIIFFISNYGRNLNLAS